MEKSMKPKHKSKSDAPLKGLKSAHKGGSPISSSHPLVPPQVPQGKPTPPIDPTLGLKDMIKLKDIIELAQQAAIQRG